MHTHIEAFHRPATIEEASALLADPDRKAVIVAGATELGLRIRSTVRQLVDISALDLGRVWQGAQGLHLGAMVRASQIHRDPLVRATAGDALPESALGIASEGVRNLTTLGGNVMHTVNWADMPVALRVLGTRFRVQGTRDVTYEATDFLAKPPRQLLRAGDLLTEVIVPTQRAGEGSAFLKFAKTRVDFAMVSCAAWVRMDGAEVAEARLAVGGFRAPPVWLSQTAAGLAGSEPTDEVLAGLRAQASAEAAPKGDFRASSGYLEQVVGVLSARCVRAAVIRATGGAA